jgi:hypothetical protein
MCGRLVPHDLSLQELGCENLGGFQNADTPYTASGDTLTLIVTVPYSDMRRELLLGFFTFVEEYSLLGTDGGPLVVPAGGPRSDSSSPQPAQEPRDPRCPATPPATGTQCDPRPAPLECEYGGDAFGRCTTFAACAMQSDASFAFVVEGGNDAICGPNPAQCPSSFASGTTEMSSGSAPACTNALVCAYAEGVCGCGTDSSASTWACRARDVGGACPSRRPLAGDGCPSEGATCRYDEPCANDLSLGPSLICQNGYWEELGGLTTCPNQRP